MHHLEKLICKPPNGKEVFIDFFGVPNCGTPQNCEAFWDFSVSAYPPEELKELFGGTARLVGRT